MESQLAGTKTLTSLGPKIALISSQLVSTLKIPTKRMVVLDSYPKHIILVFSTPVFQAPESGNRANG